MLAADSIIEYDANILIYTIYFGAVCSASDAVAEVAGSVRENIKLRRGFRYHFTTHAPPSNA